MRRSQTLAALLLVAILGACTSGAAPTQTPLIPAAQTPPGPSAPAAPTPPAPAAPSSTAEPVVPTAAPGTPGPVPSFAVGSFDPNILHAFPELEAQIPDEVAGIALEKFSVAAVSGSGETDAVFDAALAQLGKTPNDLQFAGGSPASDSDRDLGIQVFRVVGVPGDRLMQTLRTVAAVDPSSGTITETTRSGKNVLAITTDGETQYAYPAGELVFLVGGEDPLVDATLGLLP